MQPCRPSGRACTADDRRGAGRETGLHRQTEQVLASPDGLPDAPTASRPLAGTISRRILNEPVKTGRVDRGNGQPSNTPADPLAPRRPERRRPGAMHTEDDAVGCSIARAWIKT